MIAIAEEGVGQQSISKLVARGLHFHQNGDLVGAEQVYRAILEREPQNADALHLMGSVRGRQGLTAEGIELMEQAIAVSPRVTFYHNNLGNLRAAAGDTAGAEASYRSAIRVDRDNAEAHLNLGKLLEGRSQKAKARECYVASLRRAPRSVEAHMSLGRLEESDGKVRAALQSYGNAVRLDARYGAGHLALGNAQVKLKLMDKAEASYRAAIALEPRYADAVFNLANTLMTQERSEEAVPLYERAIELSLQPDATMYNNYGIALSANERIEEAVAAHKRAIELRPNFDDAYLYLGKELSGAGDIDLGIAMLRRAIEINPENAPAYVQLGVALYAKGLLHEAVEANRKALSFNTSCPVVRRNLGMSLAHTGDLTGLAMLEETVREVPNSPDLHWNLAEHSLLHGKFEQGWREYEWRTQVKELSWQYRDFDVPVWAGEDIAGKRILIYAEQGFGDTLHFARYARLVAERGATVILEVQPGLQRWCAALPGVAECFAQKSELPAFDLVVPMMSLPFLMETRADTIPPPVTPCYADRRKPGAKLQVGLVWAGNGKHVRDRLRSTRLTEWRGLATIEGVEFTSLQVGDSAKQMGEAGHGFQFAGDCGGVRDFADTAELIAGLDLVITVDTALAHLAGSMGKPVWILLYNAVDWRWGLEGDRTPWYPTARLFRQKKPAEWGDVFGEVGVALRGLVAGR